MSAGTTTDKVFDLVRKLRQKITIPLVFMTYANVVFSYGTEKFIKTAKEVGVDGLILPDIPYEEREDFVPTCQKYGIDFIPLVAPTSHERVRMIASAAEGFVYCVSSLGVTGVRNKITSDIDEMTSLVHESTDVPCAIGFGISILRQAVDMAKKAEGIIVGSAIVKNN